MYLYKKSPSIAKGAFGQTSKSFYYPPWCLGAGVGF